MILVDFLPPPSLCVLPPYFKLHALAEKQGKPLPFPLWVNNL
jgi:hypothetical protein